MTQNAPFADTAKAVSQEDPSQQSSSIGRKRDREKQADEARDEARVDAAEGAGPDAQADDMDDAEKAARKAAKEARKAAKEAEKAARKTQKTNEKTVAREARKAAEADEAARHASGKLRFESPVGRDEVAAYFEAIVEGLRKGTLQFRQGEDSLILSPPDRVGIEVKVERKSGREKLSFEIEWRTDEPEDLSILAG